MRLIDADAIRAEIDRKRPERSYEDAWALTIIDNAPTIDPQPEIIRCKDCKHRQDPNICPMTFEEWVEIDEGDGYMDSDYILHDNTDDNGYCDRAELRGEQDVDE